MNLLEIVDRMEAVSMTNLDAGGPGSGCNPAAGKCGRPAGSGNGRSGGATGPTGDRSDRAAATYVPMTAAKLRQAKATEQAVADAVGGQTTRNNSPFDVLVGRTGIEVKTIEAGVNDKITMHPESLARKLKAAKSLKLLRTLTVVLDSRHGKKLYCKQGLGSFRLVSMTPLKSFTSLAEFVK